MTTVQELASGVAERIYDRLAREARRTAWIPPEVRHAYRWTPLMDVFLDRRGRIWYADTDTMRSRLPPDPEKYERIPSEFWRPAALRALRRAEFEAGRWAATLERADEEMARPGTHDAEVCNA